MNTIYVTLLFVMLFSCCQHSDPNTGTLAVEEREETNDTEELPCHYIRPQVVQIQSKNCDE